MLNQEYLASCLPNSTQKQCCYYEVSMMTVYCMHGYYDVNGKLVIKKTERLAGVYVGR